MLQPETLFKLQYGTAEIKNILFTVFSLLFNQNLFVN